MAAGRSAIAVRVPICNILILCVLIDHLPKPCCRINSARSILLRAQHKHRGEPADRGIPGTCPMLDTHKEARPAACFSGGGLALLAGAGTPALRRFRVRQIPRAAWHPARSAGVIRVAGVGKARRASAAARAGWRAGLRIRSGAGSGCACRPRQTAHRQPRSRGARCAAARRSRPRRNAAWRGCPRWPRHRPASASERCSQDG